MELTDLREICIHFKYLNWFRSCCIGGGGGGGSSSLANMKGNKKIAGLRVAYGRGK